MRISRDIAIAIFFTRKNNFSNEQTDIAPFVFFVAKSNASDFYRVFFVNLNALFR